MRAWRWERHKPPNVSNVNRLIGAGRGGEEQKVGGIDNDRHQIAGVSETALKERVEISEAAKRVKREQVELEQEEEEKNRNERFGIFEAPNVST
uniref:Uncharacterized protein n=1 Tax=Globodera pallida TaxID=36090 RepID=A0A183CEF4_GLOPA